MWRQRVVDARFEYPWHLTMSILYYINYFSKSSRFDLRQEFENGLLFLKTEIPFHFYARISMKI